LVVRLVDPPGTGTVVFVLFDSANAFGDLRDPVLTRREFLDGRGSYRIADVPPGEYALLVYYDENDNGRMDKSFIGIPREPLGFSNSDSPKGPPSYARAAFRLEREDTREFDVDLYRPLGRRGSVSAGIGVLGRSSPYRGDGGGVFQPIPTLTYAGERLQWFGPRLQLGLTGNDRLRVAATAQYRMGVYEDDDAGALAGMGDRKDTLMAGLTLEAELPAGLELSAGYQHDALDRIGGGAARIALDKAFQLGITRLSPSLALNLLTPELANHDFGVPTNRATPDRPAYRLDYAASLEAGIGLFIEITPHWLLLLNLAAEALDPETTRSPIVDKDFVVSGFAALNYAF
jgi:outer membrane protein